MGNKVRVWHAVSLAVGVLAVSALAAGSVRHEGQWPAEDKVVAFDARGLSRADAIEKLAAAAGWSVVVHAPPSDPVDIHVSAQPASKVLDVLLRDADYVASRDGDLISIDRAPAAGRPGDVPAASAPKPAQSAAPAEPPTPPEPATASDEGGEDRVITGGSLRVAKNETVHDVVMLGGSVDVYGTVTGDVVVTGGSAHVYDGAHVRGDLTALGGSIDVDNGARVDGDVGVMGGSLRKGEGAFIGGDVKKVGHHGRDKAGHKLHIGSSDGHADEHPAPPASRMARIASQVGGAITRAAMLFVFGTMFLALASRRMETLQAEMAARPMRSLALGVVGGLVATVLLVAMCVTIIGIPFALVSVVVATLAVYVGICAGLATVGGALLGHRTRNPYFHLALGCGLFLVVGAIPYVGGLMTAAVVLIGMGAIVATRAAGLFPARPNGGGDHPYRSAPAA
jgi:hypothetical protein